MFLITYPGIKYLLLLLPLFETCHGSTSTKQSSNWSYEDKYIWGQQYPECNGRAQSPIRLEYLSVNPGSVDPLIFGNYNELLSSLVLENNGHTVEGLIAETVSGNTPYITGAKLNGIFEVANFHFHWGSPTTRGSEHTINGRRFDAEVHIVHKNTKYPTVDEARKHKDGLAVLGIMLKADRGTRGNSSVPSYNLIFSEVPELTQYGDQVEVQDAFDLQGLLGNLNTKQFYTYNGSLTTPPCSEAVTWHVFPDPIPIPYEQISRFFKLTDNRGQPLLNNYRPLQARNFRSVMKRSGRDNDPLIDLPSIGLELPVIGTVF